MPIEIEFTEDKIGVILYHKGNVNGEDLISAITTVYQSDRFSTIKYWIGDRTDCQEFSLDTESVQKIAEINKASSAINAGILLALVSPTDLQYGISRMFQVFNEKSFYKTEIFRDRESAENWINKELAFS